MLSLIYQLETNRFMETKQVKIRLTNTMTVSNKLREIGVLNPGQGIGRSAEEIEKSILSFSYKIMQFNTQDKYIVISAAYYKNTFLQGLVIITDSENDQNCVLLNNEQSFNLTWEKHLQYNPVISE